MTLRNGALIATAFLLCAICPFRASGQTGSAQVTGYITDASGAMVAGAEVTLTNTNTGIKRKSVSNDAGIYNFPLVEPGQYMMLVQLEGFRTINRDGITLYVNDKAQIDFTLEVGAMTESVQVEATLPLLETQSGTLRGVVDQQRIVDLPLNGRDITQLVSIQAGIVPRGGDDREGYRFSANGGRDNGVYYLLDSGMNTDSYRNRSGLFPNPDAVQEFSIQRNNFNAEYANATGAVVSVVTKSGTNEVHGGAFEFVRNAKFNARNFFAARRDTLKRNQFGATLGGPVVKDKLFFFFAYQGTTLRSDPGLTRQFLPTGAQRQGDFSAYAKPIKDPLTGKAFPDNQIPAGRLNPVTLAFMKFLPVPDSATGERFIGLAAKPNTHEYNTKLDYNLAAHRFSGRFFIRRFSQPFSGNMDDYASMYAAGAAQSSLPYEHVSFNDTWVLTPAVLNSATFSWRHRRTFNDWESHKIPFTYADAGVKNIAVKDPPAVNINVSGSFLARPGQQYDKLDNDYHFADTATWITGKHEFKFGFEVTRSTNDIRNYYRTMGIFNFDGYATGYAMADFMLGEVKSFQQGGGEYKYLRGNRWGGFAQDTWRVNSAFTLNYGVRWDPLIPYEDEIGRTQCFRPGMTSTRFPNSPSGYLSAGDPGCPAGGFDSSWGAIGPRLGFAWRPADTGWVIRGGGGVFWNPQFTHLYNRFVNAPPFSPQVDILATKFDDPYGGTANPFPAGFAPFNPPADSTFRLPIGTFGSFAPDFRPSYMQTVNFTIERELIQNTVARVSYVGNFGRQLSGNVDVSFGRYIPGDLRRVEFLLPRPAVHRGAPHGEQPVGGGQLHLVESD